MSRTTMFVALMPLLGHVVPVQAAHEHVRGRIMRVSPQSNEIEIQPIDGSALALKVTGRSRLEQFGHSVNFDRLEKGQRAHATYETKNGVHEIVSLRVRPTSAADVNREVREALKAAGDYAYEQKEKYEEKLRFVVDDIDDRIDELREKMKSAAQDARPKLERQIHELEKKRQAVSDRLATVKSATAAAWQDVKNGIRTAIDDFRYALEK